MMPTRHSKRDCSNTIDLCSSTRLDRLSFQEYIYCQAFLLARYFVMNVHNLNNNWSWGTEILRPCSISLQHLHKRSIEQSCWSVTVGNLLATPRSPPFFFADDAVLLGKLLVLTRSAAWGREAIGTKGLLEQNQGSVIWRLTGWHYSVCPCIW